MERREKVRGQMHVEGITSRSLCTYLPISETGTMQKGRKLVIRIVLFSLPPRFFSSRHGHIRLPRSPRLEHQPSRDIRKQSSRLRRRPTQGSRLRSSDSHFTITRVVSVIQRDFFASSPVQIDVTSFQRVLHRRGRETSCSSVFRGFCSVFGG